MRLIRTLVVMFALAGAAAGVAAVQPPLAATMASQPKPDRPPPTDEFAPIAELPQQGHWRAAAAGVAAAPMVVAAYSFIWIAFIVYCLSLVRRVKKVEADLATLEKGRR